VRTTKCKEHAHTLDVQSLGFEHVNHRLLLDGKVNINEFSETSWFVESVHCTSAGFSIVASHRQYGEPATRRFRLTPMSNGKYNLR
jgi:hypothetical protein